MSSGRNHLFDIIITKRCDKTSIYCLISQRFQRDTYLLRPKRAETFSSLDEKIMSCIVKMQSHSVSGAHGIRYTQLPKQGTPCPTGLGGRGNQILLNVIQRCIKIALRGNHQQVYTMSRFSFLFLYYSIAVDNQERLPVSGVKGKKQSITLNHKYNFGGNNN